MATAMDDLHEVEIEYETRDGAEFEYEYKNTLLGEKAKIKSRTADGRKSKQKDDAARTEVLRIVQALDPHPGMRGEDLVDRACNVLGIDRAQLSKMEVEIEYKNGNELKGEI